MFLMMSHSILLANYLSIAKRLLALSKDIFHVLGSFQLGCREILCRQELYLVLCYYSPLLRIYKKKPLGYFGRQQSKSVTPYGVDEYGIREGPLYACADGLSPARSTQTSQEWQCSNGAQKWIRDCVCVSVV